jgi:hypothetical protein
VLIQVRARVSELGRVLAGVAVKLKLYDDEGDEEDEGVDDDDEDIDELLAFSSGAMFDMCVAFSSPCSWGLSRMG